jgi:N-acetylmuramoyl-L-alanine amidase
MKGREGRRSSYRTAVVGRAGRAGSPRRGRRLAGTHLTGSTVSQPCRGAKSATARPRTPARKGSAPEAARARVATTAAGRAAEESSSKRKFYVLVSLVGVMTLTGGLLLVMRPEPVAPDTSFSLMATESSDGVFNTRVPVRAGRWKYIYVHHSRTPAGDAALLADTAGGLADHFVIGNGDGCGDGEIQIGQRWDRQEPAGRTPGMSRVDPACISVCLIGDFDHTYPTPAQTERLRQLVTSLQSRLRLDRDPVRVITARNSPAGAGRYFPYHSFQSQAGR